MRYSWFVMLILVYGCSSANSPVAPKELTGQVRVVQSDDADDDPPVHEQYDFRWSRWNDSKATVQSNEPGELSIVLHDGIGQTALESAWTTDVFVFSNGEKDTVDVEYEFAGDELYSGHYWFDETMTTTREQMLVTELKGRYGDPVETTDSRVTWMKNGDTEVYISLHGEAGGGCLHYHSPEEDEKKSTAESYNNLPVRAVVPEN